MIQNLLNKWNVSKKSICENLNMSLAKIAIKRKEKPMSDEVKEEVAAPVEEVVQSNPKQYLLMVDEASMVFLGKLMPSVLFVQVEGLAMKDNDQHMLLVNPVKKSEEEPSL